MIVVNLPKSFEKQVGQMKLNPESYLIKDRKSEIVHHTEHNRTIKQTYSLNLDNNSTLLRHPEIVTVFI